MAPFARPGTFGDGAQRRGFVALLQELLARSRQQPLGHALDPLHAFAPPRASASGTSSQGAPAAIKTNGLKPTVRIIVSTSSYVNCG